MLVSRPVGFAGFDMATPSAWRFQPIAADVGRLRFACRADARAREYRPAGTGLLTRGQMDRNHSRPALACRPADVRAKVRFGPAAGIAVAVARPGNPCRPSDQIGCPGFAGSGSVSRPERAACDADGLDVMKLHVFDRKLQRFVRWPAISATHPGSREMENRKPCGFAMAAPKLRPRPSPGSHRLLSER
jgi:hypothetical protein